MPVLSVVLTLFFLAVTLLALQNPDVVTVRVWPGAFHTSVAVPVPGAAVAGAGPTGP